MNRASHIQYLFDMHLLSFSIKLLIVNVSVFLVIFYSFLYFTKSSSLLAFCWSVVFFNISFVLPIILRSVISGSLLLFGDLLIVVIFPFDFGSCCCPCLKLVCLGLLYILYIHVCCLGFFWSLGSVLGPSCDFIAVGSFICVMTVAMRSLFLPLFHIF